MKPLLENLLLVGGSGKNVGKTTLICRIIERFCQQYALTAIKISSHIHPEISAIQMNHKRDDYGIFQTTQPLAGDSGKYIHSGASAAFFIQSPHDSLSKAFFELHASIEQNNLLIVESSSLNHYVTAGLHIFMTNSEIHCQYHMANDISRKSFPHHSFDLNSIQLIDNKWCM